MSQVKAKPKTNEAEIVYVSCDHKKLLKTEVKGYSFCHGCCCIVIKNAEGEIMNCTMSNQKCKTRIEYEPCDYFDTIKKQKDYALKLNSSSNSYSSIRKNVSRYLKKMIVKNKYSNQVYHLAMHYLDASLHGKTNLTESKVDLVTVAAFILAGIFYFKYFSQICRK
jgi:hypothetical protein